MNDMGFTEFALSDKPEERRKREIKAASAECVPISISAETQSGVFKGSSGNYNTWIAECECNDFRRRLLPCKHMYRLAQELGLYDLSSVKEEAAAVKWKITPQRRADAYEKVVALVDSYPEETQVELQSVLSDRYGDMTHICQDATLLEKPIADGLVEIVDSPVTIVERHYQKTTVEGMLAAGFVFPDDVKHTKKARYQWCLEHPDIACSYVYPGYCVVRTIGDLEIANRKTYTYLNRKFDSFEL